MSFPLQVIHSIHTAHDNALGTVFDFKRRTLNYIIL